tara:strand:+ start:1560 stop:1733 length:174 start_codon:yes stop_codon:yes gene_type:complete
LNDGRLAPIEDRTEDHAAAASKTLLFFREPIARRALSIPLKRTSATTSTALIFSSVA